MRPIIALGFFLISCQASAALGAGDWARVSDPGELSRTWQGALVYLPESAGGEKGLLLNSTEKLNEKLAGVKLPTIIYLHECIGLSYYRESLLRLAQFGFAVIPIDSFARDYRPLGCEEDYERPTRYEALVIAFRQAELDYAVRRLERLSWVDRERMFLMGSGYGARTVALYQGTEFAGHIIEGWGCHSPNTEMSGIRTPLSVPVLAIVASQDRWYEEPAYKGDCGEFMQGREDSRSIVLDLPYHYVAWHAQARPALFAFLSRGAGIADATMADTPKITENADGTIGLRAKWSVQAVYEAAREHCSAVGKVSFPVSAPPESAGYRFMCE